MRPKLPKSLHLIILLLLCALVAGCKPGYRKENGRWAWISWDEAAGRRVQFVEGADGASFHVLTDPEYAADQNAVYYRSQKIQNADPTSFRRIDRFYSRD